MKLALTLFVLAFSLVVSDASAQSFSVLDDESEQPIDWIYGDEVTFSGGCVELGWSLGANVAVGSTEYATDDHRATCTNGTGGRDTCFVWEAPYDGLFQMNTFRSDYDTVLSVHDGGNELACSDDAGYTTRSFVEMNLVQGQELTIVVDSYNRYSGGVFVLSIIDPTSAGWGQSEDISLGASVDVGQYVVLDDGRLTSGTDDYVGSCTDGSGGIDIAHSWTVPSTDFWEINTTGSDFDTVLMVFVDGYEIACNDDIHTFDENSRVFANLRAGQHVLIVVDGYGDSDTGDYMLSIDEATAQPYDTDLGRATGRVATGGNFYSRNDNTGTCAHIFYCDDRGFDHSFRWEAPLDGTFQIDTFGSTYDTVLYTTDGYQEFACNDQAGYTHQSALNVSLQQGEEIIIFLDACAADGIGSYVLNINQI